MHRPDAAAGHVQCRPCLSVRLALAGLHRLAGVAEQRASVGVGSTGSVRLGLTASSSEMAFEESRLVGAGFLAMDEPETRQAAERFHAAALRDAQALLDALADCYDVRTSQGEPATAVLLAPDPLVYRSGIVCDRHPHHFTRPHTEASSPIVADLVDAHVP